MASSRNSSIYAELLANIHQISLAASLSSPSDTSTRVAIAADGTTVELRHHDEVQTLSLPSRTALGGQILPINANQTGTTSLSWRLTLHESVRLQPRGHESIVEPVWSAIDFNAGAEVSCRQCSGVVVGGGAASVWKDLPSENWAEMMEFWHCHKPADHPHHGPHDSNKDGSGKADEESLAARGYGASSIVAAQKGVGFVDLTTLMFSDSDCQNLTFSSSSYDHGVPAIKDLPLAESHVGKNRSLNVFCASCHTQLGFYVFRSGGVTLNKWKISCQSIPGAAPSIAECLASTIISITARSGSSKSLVVPIAEAATIPRDADKDKQTAINLWVLNSNIVYSSSSRTERGISAIKLFYRLIPREEADRMLEKVAQDAQEISLPADAISEVVRHLDASNLLLPLTERVFKEWKVGLLTR